MNHFINVIKKYAQFSGRASRAEFWMFFLVNFLIGLGLMLLTQIPGLETIAGVLYLLFSLFLLIPSFAVGFRRLHDTDRSAWWWLILFIPILGTLIYLYFMVAAGTPGPNRFGDAPVS